MYFLENIFKYNKFDLNDAVLSEYNIYFDENNKNYNKFSLDDGDIPNLHKFISILKFNDPNCKIFVLTYGYELTSLTGEKFTYADQLWIDTNLSICEVKDLVSIAGLTTPSNIKLLDDCDEVEYCQIYLISQYKNDDCVISKIEKGNTNQIVTLYWD